MPKCFFKKCLVFIFLACNLTLSYSAQAVEDTIALDDLFKLSLEDILKLRVRVASTQPETIIQTPAVVSALDRADMEKLGLTTLDDILSFIPGFIMGKSTAGNSIVMARGVPFKTLLLLDGVPYWAANFSVTPLTGIAFQSIERIEVIRGPGAVIYGSNATAGVINIITRHDVSGQLTLSAGSHQYQNGEAYYTRQINPKAYLSISAHQYKTDGFNARHSSTGIAAPQDRFYATNNESKSIYIRCHSPSLNLSIHNFECTDQRMDPTFVFGVPDVLDADIYALNYRESATLLHADYQWHIQDTRINVYSDYNQYIPEHSALLPDGPFTDHFSNGGEDDFRWVGGSRVEHQVNNHLSVLGGIEYEHRETGDFNQGDLSIWKADSSYEISSYAQLDYSQDKWRFLVGGRYVDNKDAGDAVLPRASMVYNIDTRQSLKLLYAVGFTSPNNLQKDFQLRDFYGNSNLKAETIKTLDVAYSHSHNNRLFVANIYYFEGDDFIKFETKNGRTDTVNSPSYDRYGLELDYQKVINRIRLLGNLAYQHQGNEVISDDSTAVMSPKLSANVAVNFKLDTRQSLGGSLRALGERNNDVTKDTLSPVWLLNAHYDFNYNNTELTLSIKNILDQEVRQADFLVKLLGSVPVEDGINVMADLRYKF